MNILVADDDKTTCLMLQSMLAQWGYHVITASEGIQAWDVLSRADSPKLVLLDWLMPGKDGLELCRLIRGTAEPGGKYVILLSAKHEKDDMLAGLAAGADDFITKPWDMRELKCRVDAGRRILAYQDETRDKAARIAEYATQMETLAEERARQLVHADRMATIGTLSAGMAHEINNPTTFISGNGRLLMEFWGYILPHLTAATARGTPDAGAGDRGMEKIGYIIEEFPKALEGIQKGVDRIQRIVKGLKRYAGQNAGQKTFCEVAGIIRNTLDFCGNLLKQTAVAHVDIQSPPPALFADSQQIEQVLINLLTNAADMAGPQNKVNIFITARETDDQLELTVEDDGPGFSKEALKNMWRPFFTTKNVEKGTGLGLSISRGIIEGHGGAIDAENRPQGGARIRIMLPVCRRKPEQDARPTKEIL